MSYNYSHTHVLMSYVITCVITQFVIIRVPAYTVCAQLITHAFVLSYLT